MSRCADLHCGPSPYHGDALLTELHRPVLTELRVFGKGFWLVKVI